LSPDQLHGNPIDNDTAPSSIQAPIPFAIMIKGNDSTVNGATILTYDSFTNKAFSLINGSDITRNLSDLKEEVIKRTLNISGFFEADSFYPSAANHSDATEYTAIATLNGKLHAVYWTDKSEEVPDGVRNLPFIIARIFTPSSSVT
jgi:hypothetical protein